MSRLMGGLFEGNGGKVRTWVPTLDARETDEEVVYAFDLPGIPEDKISIELDDGALTVSAERERTHDVKDDRFHRFERRFGTFSRTVGVPPGISEDAISASYSDGVLEVHVKKPEQPKQRRIQIGTGAKATIEGTAAKE